jgi:hypothetical protein
MACGLLWNSCRCICVGRNSILIGYATLLALFIELYGTRESTMISDSNGLLAKVPRSDLGAVDLL